MLPKSWIARLLVAGLAAGAVACGSDKLVLPDQGRVTKVAVAGGDAQSGTVGAALAQDLTVLVTDALGRPVVGQAVVFTPAGAGNGSVDPDTVVTDGEGHAATQWVLGLAAGAQQVRAAPIVGGALSTDLAVVFTATAEAGNAARLAFLVQPSTVVAGVAMAPAVKVEVQDQNGNRVTDATTPVTLTVATNPSGGTLSGGGPVHAVNGVATFANLSLDKAGTGYTLTASASGFIAATSTAFTVNAAAPDHLEWTLSSSIAAGATIPLAQVTVRDALGNVATSPSISITVAIQNNPSGGTLSGTKTLATTNGVATFTNLSIDRTGNGYTLLASGGGLSLVSGPLNIISGDSKRLAFTIQPSDTVVGATLSTVQVKVLDANGNAVDTATNLITLVSSQPGTLAGTASVNASGGVAQFTHLRITQAGNGYTLTAKASNLADATSTPFNIAKGATTTTITSRSPTTSNVGQVVTVNYQVSPVSPASGTFTGSVTVSDGTISNTCDVPSSGKGGCPLTFNTAGTRSLTVTYAGDLNFTGSVSAAASQPVNKASPPLNITADTPDPSRIGQPVTVQWALNAPGVPATGSVVVTMAGDAATCTAPIEDGACQLTPTTPGTSTQRVITASYDGDNNYTGDTDTENHTVNVATTTTTITSLDPSPSQALQPVTVSYTVATGSGPAPTGTVSVRVNDVEKCTATVTAGACQIPGLAFATGGTFTVTAKYLGDTQHDTSSASKEQVVTVVNTAPTAHDDAASVNEDATLTVAAPGVLQNDADAENDPLTAVLVAGPAHASAFSLNADGSFSYTPAADFNGTDSFTYRASDGALQSGTATVTITVNSVNDAPSFTKGADVTVTTADGAQALAGWATNLSAGPADEAGQTLAFQVSNDNAALFAPGGEPAIGADGTLHFTPAGIEGTATVTVQLTDNGGTANGGVDTSASQTFTITVGPSPTP